MPKQVLFLSFPELAASISLPNPVLGTHLYTKFQGLISWSLAGTDRLGCAHNEGNITDGVANPVRQAGPLSSSQNSVSSGSVFYVPGILFPVSPRLCGRQSILSQRRGDAEIRTLSSLILKLPELSAGDCLRQAQAARDTG
ncbi:MAG: hypothetical protein B6245_19945 [Desulfobacteraceae bacterium 4572_88]|nr:MAG: hypothetical protein B6245_19945 [Desulfobacteraceae bacterium 4572_88]